MLFEAKDFYRETANENKHTHFKPEKKNDGFSGILVFQSINLSNKLAVY